MKPVLPLSSLMLALVALAGCSRHSGNEHQATAANALPPAQVRVAVVQTVNTPRLLELPGTIRPVDRASLAPKVMGTVEKISVTIGQSVKRGDTLVRISAREINARLAQAEAGLNQAQRDLDRETRLLEKGATTADMVRNLQDRLTMMQAMVDEARTMLAYATITAPFDGVITRKLVNEGDLASPGNALLEIENTTRLRAEVEVPEAFAGVEVGATVSVQAGDKLVSGRVVELAPASDAISRTFLAKIDLPADAALRSGQFVRVAWPHGEGAALLIPASALSLFGQMERVFVNNEGRADLRLVKSGARRDGMVEILAGLTTGESVVTDGAATLREGQPLEVR